MAFGFFRGERAVVTGAASNIGRAIAVRLAEEGASVLLVDVNEDGNGRTREAITNAGGSADALVCDLSTKDGWHRVIDVVGSSTPHMFVHSACPRRHEKDVALEVDEATFDAMLNTNVRSGLFLGRELGKRMRADKLPGRLLYITSLHAESPRNLPHYSASKAGLTMVMAELARALGPAGIRVNALAPGAVPGGGASNMGDDFGVNRKIPLQRFGKPEDMASAAVALLSNELMGYVTGITLPVDGGIQHFNWIDMPLSG